MLNYFIRGYKHKDKEQYQYFVDEIKHHNNIKNIDISSREAKIDFKKRMKDLIAVEIDLDDQEYIEELKLLVFVKAKEEISNIDFELGYKEYLLTKDKQNNPLPQMKCIQITSLGREELFIPRIKPTLSLDKYADMVLNGVQ